MAFILRHIDEIISNKNSDLTESESYLLRYMCHELSHNNVFFKTGLDVEFILRHFDSIMTYCIHNDIFITNILHIMALYQNTQIDKINNICLLYTSPSPRD